MKSFDSFPLLLDRKYRVCLYSLLPTAALLCAVYFLGTSFISADYKQKFRGWSMTDLQLPLVNNCKNQCKPPGTETLPDGIVAKTSNLQMRPLWGFPKSTSSSVNLFASAVGIKQKDLVDNMVRKFLSCGFVVILFHYDGLVDEWKEFSWSYDVIHVSAHSQTKWWFAKRFLHPNVVAEYEYIFLWDEDLGVENFHPQEYIAIVKDEGLEVSQPALDPTKSEVHHQITMRGRNSKVHRRTYKAANKGAGCDGNSKAPPCTGWIEMMAPVFSRASWRCVWHMIQNDLIHAWGLDMQLGYCAQGDRTKNIGVVDAEYIVHYSRPTLGGKNGKNETLGGEDRNKTRLQLKNVDPRVEVRRQSYLELDIFRRRWRRAVQKDRCWVDPYV